MHQPATATSECSPLARPRELAVGQWIVNGRFVVPAGGQLNGREPGALQTSDRSWTAWATLRSLSPRNAFTPSLTPAERTSAHWTASATDRIGAPASVSAHDSR